MTPADMDRRTSFRPSQLAKWHEARTDRRHAMEQAIRLHADDESPDIGEVLLDADAIWDWYRKWAEDGCGTFVGRSS